jgi:hypothetical protein
MGHLQELCSLQIDPFLVLRVCFARRARVLQNQLLLHCNLPSILLLPLTAPRAASVRQDLHLLADLVHVHPRTTALKAQVSIFALLAIIVQILGTKRPLNVCLELITMTTAKLNAIHAQLDILVPITPHSIQFCARLAMCAILKAMPSQVGVVLHVSCVSMAQQPC